MLIKNILHRILNSRFQEPVLNDYQLGWNDAMMAAYITESMILREEKHGKHGNGKNDAAEKRKVHNRSGGNMKDITFCASPDCPSKECEKKVLNNKFEDGELISVADFSGTCRFYIGWIANKVKEKT